MCSLSLVVHTDTPILTHGYDVPWQGSGPNTSGTRDPSWPWLAVGKEGRGHEVLDRNVNTGTSTCLKSPISPQEENASAQFSIACTPELTPNQMLFHLVKLKVLEICHASKPIILELSQYSFPTFSLIQFTQRPASSRVLFHFLVSLLRIQLLGTAVLCPSQLFPRGKEEIPCVSLIRQERVSRKISKRSLGVPWKTFRKVLHNQMFTVIFLASCSIPKGQSSRRKLLNSQGGPHEKDLSKKACSREASWKKSCGLSSHSPPS